MRLYLGGYPGAGKTTLATSLVDYGWHYLGGFDSGYASGRIQSLLRASEDHPEFQYPKIVGEGGFLEKAPEFREFFDRVPFYKVWLTGSRENLYASRELRGDPKHLVKMNWIAMVDEHRYKIDWQQEIDMWHSNGERKTTPEVLAEILEGVARGEP